MRSKFYLLAIFGTMLLLPLFMNSIPKCSAQSSALNITYDEYNWTANMKQVEMTTPKTGLILEITISNNSTQPLYSPTIYIFLSVTSTSSQYSSFGYTITAGTNGELYLPPKQSQVWFVNVFNSTGTESYSPIPFGDYTAQLSYSYSQYPPYPSPSGYSISPYPLDFKVESPEVLQQTIAQSTQATNQYAQIIIRLLIVALLVFVGVGIALIIVIKKQIGKVSRKQKNIQNILKYAEFIIGVINCIFAILLFFK